MEKKKERFKNYISTLYPSKDLSLLEKQIDEQLVQIIWQSIGDFYNHDIYAVPLNVLQQFKSELKVSNPYDRDLLQLVDLLINFQIVENENEEDNFPIRQQPDGRSCLNTHTQPIEPKIFTGEYEEGKAHTTKATRYERDKNARLKCIEIFGCECYICGFNFAKHYGQNGEGFIEVHHLVKVADRGGTYKPDPKEDLRPLCSNCHSIVHHCNWDKEDVEQMRSVYYCKRL